MTPERRDQLRRAKRAWRARNPQSHRDAMRRYRQVRKFARGLAAAGVTLDDMREQLEQLGRYAPSPWRSRARDLWDAWQLMCEQQSRSCYACRHNMRPLVAACFAIDGSVAGAICGLCARVLAPKSCAAAVSGAAARSESTASEPPARHATCTDDDA